MYHDQGEPQVEGGRCYRCPLRPVHSEGHPKPHPKPHPIRQSPEFIAKALREWIAAVGAKTAYIMPGSPWKNGYCESFNSKLRDELLNGEIFYTLKEAKNIIERWRRHYNTIRPHSSLGYKPPAPEAVQWPAAQPGPATPPSHSATANHELTFKSDHPMGAGH